MTDADRIELQLYACAQACEAVANEFGRRMRVLAVFDVIDRAVAKAHRDRELMRELMEGYESGFADMHWVLEGRTVRPARGFEDWMASTKHSHIAAHVIGKRYYVSSIFLSVAMAPFGGEPPHFETMIFDRNRNGVDIATRRFHSYDACERFHYLTVLGNALAWHYWHKRADDDMPPTIDFRGGVRGKYVERIK